MKFRDLRADEIECRVQRINQYGLSLLLYKDARCDQNILDETVGSMNWQKSYKSIDGKLTCTISIWDSEKGQWISKEDTGTESNTEAQKGEFSDAQKRSAFAWGIGRELYTAPDIWIKSGNYAVDDKGRLKDKFSVNYIHITNGVIDGTEIVNDKSGDVVFREYSRDLLEDKVVEACNNKSRRVADMCKYYNVTEVSELTTQQLYSTLEMLSK